MIEEKYYLGFVLGKDVAISIAEINSVSRNERIDFDILYQKNNILIVSSLSPKLSEINIDNLGGTIKLFSIISLEMKKQETLSFINENFDSSQTEKRINFGISGYGNVSKNFIFQLGIDIKDSLVNKDLKVRFVTGKTLDLSSVIVNENKLIERGFEIILIPQLDNFIIGRTISVQNYKAYSKRDFSRPKRNDRNGMLPPKLAQVMVNLSETSKDGVIYDPFCGSGTVLQEATFMGYNNVFGSDINPEIIANSEENLRWFVQNFRTGDFPLENLFTSDILNPSKKIKGDGIVCEGYLGEPLRRGKEKAIKDTLSLAEFYLKALASLERMLSENGRIVIAIPFFVVEKEYFYLPILDKLDELGLEMIKPLPENVKIFLPGRGNLTYARPDQFVGREILMLKHKK